MIKTKYAKTKKKAFEFAKKVYDEFGFYPNIRKVNSYEYGYGINYVVEWEIK